MSEQRLEDLDVAQLVALVRKERGENATLRQRAQEAEASRDKLGQQVQAAQVDAWHDLAKQHKVLEGALDDVDGRVKLSELLTDGRLDSSKAQAALDGLKASHAYYFEQAPAVPSSSGSATHTGGSQQAPQPTMSDFLAS